MDGEELWREQPLQDDRLRLIFTCCHPALSPEAPVALTLRVAYRRALELTPQEPARRFLERRLSEL